MYYRMSQESDYLLKPALKNNTDQFLPQQLLQSAMFLDKLCLFNVSTWRICVSG